MKQISPTVVVWTDSSGVPIHVKGPFTSSHTLRCATFSPHLFGSAYRYEVIINPVLPYLGFSGWKDVCNAFSVNEKEPLFVALAVFYDYSHPARSTIMHFDDSHPARSTIMYFDDGKFYIVQDYHCWRYGLSRWDPLSCSPDEFFNPCSFSVDVLKRYDALDRCFEFYNSYKKGNF